MKKDTNSSAAKIEALHLVGRGERNEALFRHLMSMAPSIGSPNELISIAYAFNTYALDPPLQLDEVKKTAHKVWHYQTANQNFIGDRRPRIVIDREEVDELLKIQFGIEALGLLVFLRRNHGARIRTGELIPIACKAMAATECIAGWRDWRRYRRALTILTDFSFVVKVREEGRLPDGTFEPALYALRSPGTKNVPNSNNTPPSPFIRGQNRKNRQSIETNKPISPFLPQKFGRDQQ